MSAFKDAIEARDMDALERALAPDVVFRSPAVHGPYEGREITMAVLRTVMQVFEGFHYVGELRDGDQHLLRFVCTVGDKEVDGIDLVREDADGLVAELTVFIRPLSALQAVQQAVGARLAAQAAG
jgi:hypothetical protein